jgi:hypothetical protein
VKARWTRWQGGHGAVHAYSLELGNLLNASIKLKIESRQWEVRLNQTHLGDFDSPEEAVRRAEECVRDYARAFIEDWTIWTASQCVGTRMPKGWW